MVSAKACTFSFGVLLVSLFGLAFLTSTGALSAYLLAFVNAAVTLLVAYGLERLYKFTAAGGGIRQRTLTNRTNYSNHYVYD